MRLAALMILSLSLAGCVQFPEIEEATGAAAEQADFPDLVPFDQLPQPIPTDQTGNAETQEQLEARVRRLEARAAALQGGVLSEEDRNRLEEGVE